MTRLVCIVVILTSIEPILEKSDHLHVQLTILISFEAILKSFSVRINFKSRFQSNDLPEVLKYIKIALKLTSIVTILANVALAVEHIFQVLGQYL